MFPLVCGRLKSAYEYSRLTSRNEYSLARASARYSRAEVTLLAVGTALHASIIASGVMTLVLQRGWVWGATVDLAPPRIVT